MNFMKGFEFASLGQNGEPDCKATALSASKSKKPRTVSKGRIKTSISVIRFATLCARRFALLRDTVLVY